MANKQPVAKFRAGYVSCSIWENEAEKDGKKFKILKATFQKTYKDGEEFKTTNSLDINDIPRALYVLQKSYDFMVNK